MRRHVARNALQPTVSVIGVQIGYLFAGLIAVELIFNYPGLGNLIYNAVDEQGLPAALGSRDRRSGSSTCSARWPPISSSRG